MPGRGPGPGARQPRRAQSRGPVTRPARQPGKPIRPGFSIPWAAWSPPPDGTPLDLLKQARFALGRLRSKIRSAADRATNPALIEACQHDLALLDQEERRLLGRMGEPIATIANEGPW